MWSLKSRCIGIRILIKALYIRFQLIYHHSATLSKSSGITISLAMRVMKEQDITYLLIRSSGISLNLWLLLLKLPLNDITPLHLKLVLINSWYSALAGKSPLYFALPY